jgi:hypothetical protein
MLLIGSVVFALLAVVVKIQVSRGFPKGDLQWQAQKRAVWPQVFYVTVAAAVTFFALGIVRLLGDKP